MNEVQRNILDIFLEIDKICVRHNLRYYAIGGTCLGAVRHQGFIPWDDDMDIAMPETDFEQFMKIASNELPNHLSLITIEAPHHRSMMCAKVHNIHTTFIEEIIKKHKEDYLGIFVDIMPLYGMPERKKEREKFVNVINTLVRLNEKKKLDFIHNKSMLSKIVWIIMRPVNYFLSDDFYIQIWKKKVSKYHFDTSKYTGYLWCRTLKKDNLIFKKSWFDNYVELPFENIKMRCPCDWNAYLSCQFGNYMKLPPENERENHENGAIIDVNQSYKIYQQAVDFVQ